MEPGNVTGEWSLGTRLGSGAWECDWGVEPGNEVGEWSLGTRLGSGAWECDWGVEPGNEGWYCMHTMLTAGHCGSEVNNVPIYTAIVYCNLAGFTLNLGTHDYDSQTLQCSTRSPLARRLVFTSWY